MKIITIDRTQRSIRVQTYGGKFRGGLCSLPRKLTKVTPSGVKVNLAEKIIFSIDLGYLVQTQCKSSALFWNSEYTTMGTENKSPLGITFSGSFCLSDMSQNKKCQFADVTPVGAIVCSVIKTYSKLLI